MQTLHRRGLSLLIRGRRKPATEKIEFKRQHLRNSKHQPPRQVRTQVREVRELSLECERSERTCCAI